MKVEQVEEGRRKEGKAERTEEQFQSLLAEAADATGKGRAVQAGGASRFTPIHILCMYEEKASRPDIEDRPSTSSTCKHDAGRTRGVKSTERRPTTRLPGPDILPRLPSGRLPKLTSRPNTRRRSGRFAGCYGPSRMRTKRYWEERGCALASGG